MEQDTKAVCDLKPVLVVVIGLQSDRFGGQVYALTTAARHDLRPHKNNSAGRKIVRGAVGAISLAKKCGQFEIRVFRFSPHYPLKR